MNRMGMLVLTAMTVATMNVIVVATASATPPLFFALCSKVREAASGLYDNGHCSKDGGSKNWAAVSQAGAVQISGDLWCAQSLMSGTGLFSSSACAAHISGGSWNLVLLRRRFVGTSATSKLATGSIEISCASNTETGELTGTNTVGDLKIVFKGCKVKKGTEECALKSQAGATEEVLINTLKGELGSIKITEGASETGLLVLPETTKKLALFSSSKCAPETTVTGSIGGELSSVGALANGFALGMLIRLLAPAGRQLIRRIGILGAEVEPELEAYGSVATEETTAALEYEEAVLLT